MRMSKSKGVLAVIILLVFSVSYLAGGGAPEEEEVEEQTIIFSGTFAEGQAQVDTQRKFKELLEERSDGRYEVRVITGMAMGGGREHIEQCQAGDLHLIATGPESIAIYNPSYNVENIPFLFEDWDHLWSYIDGEPGEIVQQQVLDSLDIRTLGTQIRGARLLTANTPIRSQDDLDGLRLRLSETRELIRIWGAAGASPTPISFAELYSALETGVVEAQENPIETIYGQKFYEVQDYMMETNHILSISYFQASEEWFSELPQEDQELIAECMTDAVEYGNEIAERVIDDYRDEMLDEGWITLIEQEEIDMQSIREPAVEEIDEMVEEGVYNRELYEMALELAND